jgi:cysteinyl-tRNA synthetase
VELSEVGHVGYVKGFEWQWLHHSVVQLIRRSLSQSNNQNFAIQSVVFKANRHVGDIRYFCTWRKWKSTST